MKIRASVGTAAALGLDKIKIEVQPTTAYLMLYTEGHCRSNCSFCPQARESSGRSDRLSRIIWPIYDLTTILRKLKQNKSLKRICIQTINFENAKKQIIQLLEEIEKAEIKRPISLCTFPIGKEFMMKLKEKGVTRVGISFDCATPEIFNDVKGINRGPTLSWAVLEEALIDAIDVFGKKFVSTHLIIGLGESEQEAIEFLQKFISQGITVGLFAFTPIRGTELETLQQPDIQSYRRIQLAHYLILHNYTDITKIAFGDDAKGSNIVTDFGVSKSVLEKIIDSGKPFQTSGCSHCNRPFYNESPGTELFNYPAKLSKKEIEEVKKRLHKFL